MIITFASSKGGVGKSTSCVALAGAYARAGQRVHIIDLDGNKTAARWLGDDALRPANISISVPDPQLLTEHLQEAARLFTPDLILIDIAGAYEQALTIAIARAHLTIIPASTTEADIFEAARVAPAHPDCLRRLRQNPALSRVGHARGAASDARPGARFQVDRTPQASPDEEPYRRARRLRRDRPFRASPALRRPGKADHRQGHRRAGSAQNRDRHASRKNLRAQPPADEHPNLEAAS